MNDYFSKTACDRCHSPLPVRFLSRMNLDTLCRSCEAEEHQHPLYKKAAEAELVEVKRGNYNYPGLYAGKAYPFGEELGDDGLTYVKAEKKADAANG